MNKKVVVCYIQGSCVDMFYIMKNFMDDLSGIHGIHISRVNNALLCFETPHVLVRYINDPIKLRGFWCDEIFNAPLDIERVVHRRSMEPYSGTMLEYILDVERYHEYERTYLGRWCDMTGEINIVDFTEGVLGIQLLDCQKELLLKMYENRNCKVATGRLGKMYFIPDKKEE